MINTSLGKGEDSLPYIGVLDIFGGLFIPRPVLCSFSITCLVDVCRTLIVPLPVFHTLAAVIYRCLLCRLTLELAKMVIGLVRTDQREKIYSSPFHFVIRKAIHHARK